MSKMRELATALDEISEVGHRLMACGEDLIRAVARVKDCFTDDSAEVQPQESAEAHESAPEQPAPKTYTKEEVRAMLASLSQSGFRAEAKALVKKYSNGGSLTDIDPADYPELVKEAKQYHV